MHSGFLTSCTKAFIKRPSFVEAIGFNYTVLLRKTLQFIGEEDLSIVLIVTTASR